MSDFETIKLRAPYRALIPARHGVAAHEAVDTFECVLRVAPPDDVIPVAMFRHRATGYGRQKLVSVDGRLFHPYNGGGTYTPEYAREKPPLIRFEPERLVTNSYRSALLGSPFGRTMAEGTDWMRDRARKADPEAHEEAGRRVRALAAGSMLVVDGMLHHEITSPAWAVSSRRGDISAAIPELHDEFAHFVDPRYGARELADFLELGREGRTKLIDVYEAALLPPTTEADAMAAIALRLLRRAARHRVGELDPRFLADIFWLLQETEDAVAAGGPFEECYAHVESVASWAGDGEGDTRESQSQFWIAEEAALFMDLRAAFPPRQPPPPGDDIEPGTFAP